LLQHPGEDPLISLEYVDGVNLTTMASAKTHGIFAWEEIKDWMLQLADALEYAHTEKTVHRDLKPGNLMINSQGRLKLADFGIAATVADSLSRSSIQGIVSGTTLYMSPQQMEGEAPKVTDDVYAYGATIYELLTGKPPFFTGNVEHQVLNVIPTPLTQRLAEFGFVSGIPPYVHELVMACLAKDPEARPQSMSAIREWVQSNGKLGNAIPTASTQTIKLLKSPDSLPLEEPDAGTVDSSVKHRKMAKMGLAASGIILVAFATLGSKGFYNGYGQGHPKNEIIPDQIKESDVLLIKDPILKKCLSEALKIEKNKLTIKHLSKLENLNLAQKGIKNIGGLQHCINLKSLSLAHNQVADLKPLQRLAKLESLSIAKNGTLINIGPLARLSNLKSLNAEQCQIVDISPLQRLTKLESLNLNYNRIEVVPDLSALTKIKILNFYQNRLLDLRGLKGMNWLESLLIAKNSTLSKIGPVSGLTNLKSLNAEQCKIVDISPLQPLANLESLNLNYNPIEKIPNFLALKKIKGLGFYGTRLNDLSGIRGMIWLESLSVAGHPTLTDISPVKGLINLKVLNAEKCQIVDITPLEKLAKLESLNLNYNPIEKVPDLSALTKIKGLGFYRTRLRDLSGIKGMTWLESLSIAGHPTLIDIDPIKNLTNLKTLNIEKCQIKDIKPLQRLAKLETLNLTHNRIEVVPDLSALTKIKALSFYRNQLGDLSGIEKMTWLESLDIRLNGALTDITPIKDLVNLNTLLADTLKITDISPIINLAKLEKAENLRLHSNQIQVIPDMSNLILVETLDLNANRLVDIEGLRGMKFLTSLKVHNNKTLSDLSPLAGANRLTELLAYSCKLTDIAPVSQIPNLKTLDLHSNTIVDIKPISGSSILETLVLHDNQIETVPDLSNLVFAKNVSLSSNNLKDIGGFSGMDRLESLDVSDNPLLSNLEPLSGLRRLKSLSAANCSIENLVPLWELKNLKVLDLRGNPIKAVQLNALKRKLHKDCKITHDNPK